MWRLRNGPEKSARQTERGGRRKRTSDSERQGKNVQATISHLSPAGIADEASAKIEIIRWLDKDKEGKISPLLYSANVTVDTTEDLPTPVVGDESN